MIALWWDCAHRRQHETTMSESLSHTVAPGQAPRKAPMDIRPYARPGSGPTVYGTRVRPLAAALPADTDLLLEPVRPSEIAPLPMALNEPMPAAEPDLDLPWVTAYLVEDTTPASASSAPLPATPVAEDVPTSQPTVSSTPNYSRVVEGWLLQDTAAKLSEFSMNPRAFVRGNEREREHSTPMFAWRDEDLPMTMSADPNGSDAGDPAEAADSIGVLGNAELAARALESLAHRVRAGQVHLPVHSPDLSEAALLAAALLALLSIPA